MPLGALPCCWAHLVGVLGWVNLYLEPITLINTYLALFTAIGGQDRMDGRVVPTTFMIKPRHLPAHSYLSCQLEI